MEFSKFSIGLILQVLLLNIDLILQVLCPRQGGCMDPSDESPCFRQLGQNSQVLFFLILYQTLSH
jgi:hypothetical protein